MVNNPPHIMAVLCVRMDSIVIGGTGQLNNFNTNPTAQETKEIIARVSRIVPSIKVSEVTFYFRECSLR